MKSSRFAGLAVALFATWSAAWAGSTTTTLNVTASVPQNCLVTTTPVAFGDYDPVSANSSTGADVTAAGSVSVTCTKSSLGINIALGAGAHFSATRRLAGATYGDFLAYELYQPSAATPGAPCVYPGTVWNATGGGLFSPNAGGWGATTAFSFNICGSIPKAQNVSADSYSDAIVLTINF